jgi:hypothetical protein
VLSALYGEPWRGSISGRGFHPSGGIEARVTASGDRTGRHARVRVGAPRTMYFAGQSETSGVIISKMDQEHGRHLVAIYRHPVDCRIVGLLG